jgi:alkylhydroperoxidase family enzyme
MSRVTAVYRPSDYPGAPDAATQAGLAELFGRMFPGVAEPEIARDHAGIAIAALNPGLALRLSELSRYVALETGFGQRAELRELAIAAVNWKFRSDFSIAARRRNALAAGLSEAQLAALPEWERSELFSAEQKLVVGYALAAAAGDVPEALFAQVVAAFGEREAVELTAVVGLWSFWAMLINATQPRLEPEAGAAGA